MKKLLTCFVLICAATVALAQTIDCEKGISAFRYYLHDTIHVKCDTVYLINAATYKFYKNNLQKVKANTPLLNDLVKLYEERIAQQANEYATLRKSFDETLGTSKQFIEHSQSDLSKIKDTLTHTSVTINQARTQISEVKGILETEIKDRKKINWKWGLGGVILGIAIKSFIGGN
jgi:hypothetical protein